MKGETSTLNHSFERNMGIVVLCVEKCFGKVSVVIDIFQASSMLFV